MRRFQSGRRRNRSTTPTVGAIHLSCHFSARVSVCLSCVFGLSIPVCSCSRNIRRLSLGWRSCPAELLDRRESPLPTASAAPPSSHLTDACRRKTPPSHSPLSPCACVYVYVSLSPSMTHILPSLPLSCIQEEKPTFPPLSPSFFL